MTQIVAMLSNQARCKARGGEASSRKGGGSQLSALEQIVAMH